MAVLRSEVQELLELFAHIGLPALEDMTPVEAREWMTNLRIDPEALPPVRSQTDRVIPGPSGDINIRIYRQREEERLPVLVWFHGGGWVFGDLFSSDFLGRQIASQANCVVIAVDYRLAPEHAFPAAFDDCLAATKWVADNAEDLQIDASRLAVGGDSAGGNLAAVVATHAAEAGLELCHQLLIYPVVEAGGDRPSYAENADGFFLTKASMDVFLDHYLSADDHGDPRFSPLSSDLTKVPSAWVFTAGFDPLRDEGQAYADMLEAAGVSVERYHVADVIHGVFGMNLECGNEARSAAALSLAQAFGGD